MFSRVGNAKYVIVPTFCRLHTLLRTVRRYPLCRCAPAELLSMTGKDLHVVHAKAALLHYA
jgi:hypothetical protein